MIRTVRVDDTSWPVDVMTDDEDSAQWVQRYGTPERVVEQRMSVASVMAAYAHLLDPSRTMREVEAALRRARQAAREAV